MLMKVGNNELELVTIKVGTQTFGINVDKVQSVEKAFTVSKVPNSDERVVGVAIYREKPLSLIGLDKSLNIPCEKNWEDRKTIVTSFNQLTLGFEVTDVVGIERVSWEDVEAVPEIIRSKVNTSHITGIIKLCKEIVMILDLEAIVGDIIPTLMSVEEHHDLSEVTVYLAEDSVTIREMLVTTLREGNPKELKTFDNGKDLYDFISQGHTPDIVITDLEMPQMDGLHLISKLRETHKTLPIVVFSSLINEQMKAKCKEVGSTYEVSKPQLGELLFTVKHLVGPGVI